jgi:hypothetical protein
MLLERIKLLFGDVCDHEIKAGRMRQQQWQAWLAVLQEEERRTLVASVCIITCSGKLCIEHGNLKSGVARKFRLDLQT